MSFEKCESCGNANMTIKYVDVFISDSSIIDLCCQCERCFTDNCDQTITSCGNCESKNYTIAYICEGHKFKWKEYDQTCGGKGIVHCNKCPVDKKWASCDKCQRPLCDSCNGGYCNGCGSTLCRHCWADNCDNCGYQICFDCEKEVNEIIKNKSISTYDTVCPICIESSPDSD